MFFVLLEQRVGKNHLSMVRWVTCKIFRVSKTRRKVGVSESQEPQGSFSHIFMLFRCSDYEHKQFCLKKLSLAEPQILMFRGVLFTECHPKEGGMLSCRISGRHYHCLECKWAEDLNRWLQWDMDSTDGEFIPSEISGGMDDSPIWLQTSKACITPPHPVITTFSSLEKAKGLRNRDTYMGREKTENGRWHRNRYASLWDAVSMGREVEQLLLTSFFFQYMSIHRTGHLGFQNITFVSIRSQ